MIDNLEGLLLAAAEGDGAAVNTLAAAINKIGVRLPAPDRNQISSSLALILGKFEQHGDEKNFQELAFVLAAHNFDASVVRDALAVAIRHQRPDFPDPARLVSSLGILSDLPLPTVLARWRAYGFYEHKAVVWHDEYGLGSMREIDPLADLVTVSFKNIQRFTFEQAIATLHLAEPGSLAHTLTLRPPPNYDPTGSRPNSRTESAKDVRAAIAGSFTPPPKFPKLVAQTILVPKIMTLKAFDDWHAAANKTSGVAGSRNWDDSRSLEELKEALKKDELLEIGPESAANMLKVFRFSHEKAPTVQLFADCLSRMRLMASDPSWVDALAPQLVNAIAWQDEKVFLAVTCKVPAKQVAPWLTLARLARGHEWLVRQIVDLPLRCWDAAESVFDAAEEPIQDLFDLAVRRFRKGAANADVALWLWRQDSPFVQQLFANPKAVFRVLAKEGKGDFLKAHRDFRKLLMEDQVFQRTVMGGGGEESIAAFVRTVRTMPLLQSGEQQSLLVKVVRLFPEAAEIVEDRRQVIERRPLPQISSVRSVELKRRELEDIIKTQIPENTRAIAHARSYGDLRENFEFKAAKERQRFLMARRADLEAGLNEVSATDFSEVVIGKTIIPGCTVLLSVDGSDDTYHVLGLWDSSPEDHILSFEAPMGRLMIGRGVGDSFENPQGKKATIKKIEPLPAEIIKLWVDLPADA